MLQKVEIFKRHICVKLLIVMILNNRYENNNILNFQVLIILILTFTYIKTRIKLNVFKTEIVYLKYSWNIKGEIFWIQLTKCSLFLTLIEVM